MSVARGFLNGGHFYSNITQPVKIDCSFVVDPANGNGLGIRSLKSNGYVRNVFMHTTASFTGTLNATVNVTGIASGTATLVVGMPVSGANIPAGTTIASIVSSSAITLSKAATGSATEVISYSGFNDNYASPNPLSGYALIQLKQNFNSYLGGFSGYVSPLSGSNIGISGAGALTLGTPYVITAVGAVPSPKFTVTTVADSSGSLAGKYMTVTDAFSNNYVLYNVVSGVGTPPSLTGALAGYIAVPVSFTTNAANTAVATAISNAIANLNGGGSFTTSVSSNIVTATSSAGSTILLPLAPNAQTSTFTVSAVTYTTLAADWQSVGVPPGLVPNAGLSFVATSTGSALGSGTVKVAGVSGIGSLEVIGDPNQSIGNASIASNGGAWLLVQFLAPTNSSTTTPIPTAPATGSVVGMSFFFDASSVTIDGL